jgi:FkbM family methyltransferase
MTQIEAAAPYQLTQTRHGLMLVNRNDVYMGQALMVYGDCCEIELQLLLALAQQPGLIVEAGANMGIHTVPMAQQLARQERTLIAFEPQPVIFQQLCANLALNGLMNVKALPYACGSANGPLMFEIPDYRNIGNFGGTSMSATLEPSPVSESPGSDTPTGRSDQPPRHEIVQCVRLDAIVGEGDVGMIKIDVEGHELEVLKGCEGIFARCHPLLYVENDRIEKSEALIQFLFDRDYRLWWHLPPLFNPQNYRGVTENYYTNTRSFNMVGIHKSSDIPIEGATEILDCHDHPLIRAAELEKR